jgi:hypothetical protein
LVSQSCIAGVPVAAKNFKRYELIFPFLKEYMLARGSSEKCAAHSFVAEDA